MMRLFLLFTLSLGVHAARRERTNPLGKVLQLLEELAAKVTKEGAAEAKAFKEYVEWCDDTKTETGFEIKTSSRRKEKLDAHIMKVTGDEEAASAKIEELAGAIANDEKKLKAAVAVRAKESEDFKSSEKELLDVISSLTRASSILSREMAKNPAVFAQIANSGYEGVLQALNVIVDAASFSNNDKQNLVALVQSRSDDVDDEIGAPAAASYKSHSGGILDAIDDLKEKAEGQLSELRKGETNARHNFEMLKQSLEDSIAADSGDLSDVKAAKQDAIADKATAVGDLANCVSSLKKAKARLETVGAECTRTAEDHAASESARSEELKVIAEAKKILAETSGGAVGQTYSMVQLANSAKSRLQSHADAKNAEVLNFVRRLAKKEHSSALAQLASRIGAVLRFGAGVGEDPFAKIKGLIAEMITKLESQAEAEATEKAYCDEEMAKTEEKEGDLESDVSKLTSKIDKNAARSATLKAEVKDLQSELATLAKLQAEMDKIRTEAHSAFVQAKADLELGLEGVRNALTVLRDYYGAAETALLQSDEGIADLMKQPEMPPSHQQAEGAGSSIIGILEVCESDFAKNLATEETGEADAQEEYEKITQDNAIQKTEKTADVKYKTKEFKDADATVALLTKDLDTTQEELSAVAEYHGKLKERCIAKPETYEERRNRRTAEIEGLKRALTTLESETALLQRRSRNLRSHRAVVH